jgi:predicted ATPase with chaperone activity
VAATRQPKSSAFDWDSSGSPEAPSSPETLREAGLSMALLTDLLLRALYHRGAMLGLDLARYLCLPFKIVEEGIRFLKDEKCIEVTGGEIIGRVSYRFALTDLGRERAHDAMRQCAYVGPAPVPLEDFIEQTYRQTVTGITCTPDAIRGPFAHLVLPESMFSALGPAIVSGKSVFIYGPPGNGKTAMARAIGEYMNQQGGSIFLPHAFLAEGSIVTVFDPSVHVLDDDRSGADEASDMRVRELLVTHTVDARWVKVRRPVIVTGGELNLEMLDLRYNPTANYYQAPLHVKANGGVFLIDDFGRQLCSPKELLNRWILPLEDRHDFLTLSNGKKFQIPFEQLILFSTNLDPKDLVDDAFLRRIRHKVQVHAPTRDIYEKIFSNSAKRLGMSPCPEAIEFLYERYYEQGRSPRASDCRDLLEIVQSICRFKRQPVQLTRELIAEAASTFIAEF